MLWQVQSDVSAGNPYIAFVVPSVFLSFRASVEDEEVADSEHQETTMNTEKGALLPSACQPV
jgi:hypothetical protein